MRGVAVLLVIRWRAGRFPAAVPVRGAESP